MGYVSYKIGRAYHVARNLRGSGKLHDLSYPEMVRRLIKLRRDDLFTIDEIFLRGLLDLEPTKQGVEDVMSKTMTLRLQRRLNPEAAEALTEDKSVFYSHCRACGLPAPELYAVFGRRLGWTAQGEALRCEEVWAGFLKALHSDEIVIKPSAGVYGRGIRLLRRDGEQWIDQNGHRLSPRDLVALLRRDEHYDSFVIQQWIHSHPALRILSNTDYLQTVRIVTAFSADGEVELLIGNFKIIAGNASTDNYAAGRTGNLMADILLDSGRLGVVMGLGEGGLYQKEHAIHPITGRRFAEFELPYWRESCELARRAARHFLPLLTVGWDIAVTPEGPLLIEGNASWDPHNAHRQMRVFRDYARRMFGADAA
ncbi:MAG: sugar-transfer associated ATP-grasp domain-containing protein [Kiloniellales bacterium]